MGLLREAVVRRGVVPAIVAGAAGLMLAAWQTRLLLALAPAAMPRAGDVSLDLRVVLFAIAATLVTGIAVGLWPAIRMSRIRLSISGDSAAPAAPRRRWPSAEGFVAAEVAISLVLAVAKAQFVQSLRRVQEVAPGFATERGLSMRLSLSRERYTNRADVLVFQERLAARLRALPGVEAVGGTSSIPLSGMRASVDFVVDGQAVRPNQMSEAEYRIVSPGYFDALGIRLLNGREFTDRDRA